VILARYLLTQFIPPFLFGLSLFSGVLLLDKIFDLIDLLVNKGVPLALSAKIFSLFLPTVLSLSVPMSVLLACLLTFGRLSEDNEILALRSSGLSFRQILWPPLLLAALIAVALVPFNTQLAPRAMGQFRSIHHQIVKMDPLQIEPNQFVSLRNIRLYAGEVVRDKKLLKNVWLYRLFPDYTERVYAPNGKWDSNDRQLNLTLLNGQIERFSRDPAEDFLHIAYKTYGITVPLMTPTDERSRNWREHTSVELRRELQQRTLLQAPTGEIRSEYHLRYAIAFAPLALALVGVPLGMTLERGGRGVGFSAAVGVLFVYYLLLVMGMNLAEKEKVPPPAALWMANAVATVAGLVLFRRRLST
jgi:lipopolysaccharide export system permease protein